MGYHAHRLSNPNRRPGTRAVPRPRVACLQSPVPRRRLTRRVVRAALHPVSRLSAVLRAPRISLAAEADEGHTRLGGSGCHAVPRPRQAGAPGRTRRLRVRRRIDQSYRQPAAAQARLRADRERPRRAGDPRLSRSGVGQHLQLQGRTVLLEAAGSHSLPGHRRVRPASTVDDIGRTGATRADGARRRPRRRSPPRR